MNKLRLAIVCLSSCSNYHQSFLNIEQWLLNHSGQIDLIYSPLKDSCEYPEVVDIVLVEGSVLSKDNLELLQTVRDRSNILISFGDCAVNHHVTTLGHSLTQLKAFFQGLYLKITNKVPNPIPHDSETVSTSLESVQPIPALIDVDVYLPGCPPNANYICTVLELLLMGEYPHLMGEQIRFS
ncbi:MAG: oxidoreductase [Waterburya sp.]